MNQPPAMAAQPVTASQYAAASRPVTVPQPSMDSRPAPVPPTKKKKRPDLDASKFTAQDLTENDLEQVITTCGAGIEDIYTLAPGQKWMFEKANEVTSAFFLQYVFKAVIPLKPHELRQKIDEVSEMRDNLRSAYVYRGVSQPYRVVLMNRLVELRFEELEYDDEDELDERLKSIMDADRRRGFDLEKDTLLRIAVYATKEPDTYAILVSQPHINTDGVSMMLLMKDIFIDYALEMKGINLETETFSYKEYAEWLESRDKDKEIDYWKEILKDSPPLTRIPALMKNGLADFKMTSEKRTFPEEVQKGLKEKQAAFHATQNNLMQTAWAVLLMKLYCTDDCMFGAITSGRDADVAESSKIAGGFVNAFPVRARAEGQEVTVASLVSLLQKQIIKSLGNSHVSPGEIRKALGRQEPLFDHLLNFHNFMQVKSGGFSAGPSIPGIKLIGGEMYDNLSTDLVVYFVNSPEGLGTNFVYNQNHLTSSRIEVLMDCFYSVVEQIALGSDDLRISDIECPDISVFRKAIENEQSVREEIEAFIRSLGLFAPEHEPFIHQLALAAKLETFEEDDLIFKEGQKVSDLMYVYDGFVELSREASDGWMKSLMVLKSQKIITATGIVDGAASFMEAQAVSKTRILVIPRDVVMSIIGQCPEFAVQIIGELEKRLNAYSRLWVYAD
ncbi:MAG: cyclic nucleotide-binding domain-containing protein [Lachnospiraceae bacterium]|nr:cyclic nucleotide-binding domain-containing protein [Lachnospiraceae bacterium]